MATQSFNLLLPSLESELVAGEEVATCLLHGFLLAFQGKFTRFQFRFFSRVSDNHRRHRFVFFCEGAKIGITSDDKDEFCWCYFDGWEKRGDFFFGRKSEKERDIHRKSVGFRFFLLFCLNNSGRIQIFIYRQKHFARKVGVGGVMAIK